MVQQSQTIEIVSINVSLPKVLVSRPTGDIVSGIDKKPVTTPTLQLGRTNLEGDGQQDTKMGRFGGEVHGGPEQAVYAFPSEHYPLFEAEAGRKMSPGLFGENITTRGVTEKDVYIGDVWEWGDALLQVSVSRSPCYKWGIQMGRQIMRRWIREKGMVGWYFRVLRTGTVPTSGTINIVERHPAKVSVLEIHYAIDGGGIGPKHLQDLDVLSIKARNKLKTAGRDLTGGILESDSVPLVVPT
jgi:MOSC domain-containing protein YiiM